MKTIVFLIRHGETQWNVHGKFQGCCDIELDENGIVQAKCLKKNYENKFDYIYTSPLKRAFETAKILCSTVEKKPLITENLREINFGEWEGMTEAEIENNYPEVFKMWKTGKNDGPICGGDKSLKLASMRATNAILKIVERHKGSRIAIIAHGGIIKAGLIGIFKWDMGMYQKIALGNTAVNEIHFDEKLNPCLVTLNDTHHLSQGSICMSFV